VPVLDFDNAPAPKKPKNLRRLLGLGTFTALIGIGVAFATPSGRNITNDTAEFGQGFVATTACDSSINVAPVSTFDNEGAVFELSSIELTDIASECASKYFTIKAYGESGDTPISIDGSAGDTGDTWVEFVNNRTAITIDLDSTALADSVFKITIESTDDDPSGP
jgi:hypothetical protein